MKMVPNVVPIGPYLELGEGPYWDEESQVLYYVDIFKHTIHSYKPQTDEHHAVVIEVDKPISLIIKAKDQKNKFVISIKSSLACIDWDGVSSNPIKPEYLMNLESDENLTGINDGKCDPSNRLWAGTMSILRGEHYEQEMGSLYSLFQNGKKVVKHLSKISMSNGLAWSPDKNKFYFIDSLKYKIDSYDYDDTSGSISNEKTVFCFKKNNIEGLPDGMTIDQEGMLWVACFTGAQVIRIDPTTGELNFTLKIPSYQVTSVCFGGPQLEDLYVTSAKINFTGEEENARGNGLNFTKDLEDKYPLAGKTFRVTGLGIKGTPSMPIQL